MPPLGNVLTRGGIGPTDYPSQAPTYFWVLATFLGVFGAILLVLGLVRSMVRLLHQPIHGVHKEGYYVLAFALVLSITYFAPLPLLGLSPSGGGFFDRYLIVLLPWLMVICVITNSDVANFRPRGAKAAIGAGVLLAISAFSVAATHDYLASNRVLWIALNRLMRDYGVGPEKIDGGFEFNGWYLYDDAYTPKPGKGWDWVSSDEYSVGPSLRQGYVRLETYPVNRWLPWGHGLDIIVQHRIDHSAIPGQEH